MVNHVQVGDFVLTPSGSGEVVALKATGYQVNPLFVIVADGETPRFEVAATVAFLRPEGVAYEVFAITDIVANLEDERPRGELVMRVACNKD